LAPTAQVQALGLVVVDLKMTLLFKDGRITKYDKPEDILAAFYDVRLDYYSRRKELFLRKDLRRNRHNVV
jgi:DNA gyrase/topoisomerase IV subunit A